VVDSAYAESQSPLDTASPNGAASLDSIVRTEEMLQRPSRPPEPEKENSALAALVIALADSPSTILQTLADKVLEVLRADSAGLSLLTKDGKRFYWAAIAGAWQPHLGGGTPRNFGPCGDVLDRDIAMLFTHWELRYPYLGAALPLAEEGLLVPFFVNGKSVGTIWAIAHSAERKFDTEDLRVLQSMGRFASAAYQTVESIEVLKLEVAAREKAEANLRDLAGNLEEQVHMRTEELRFSEDRWKRIFDNSAVGISVVDLKGRFVMANSAYQRMVGFTEDELREKTYLDVILPDFQPLNIALMTELLDGRREQFNIEKQCRRKDGRLIWVRNNVSFLPGADGAPRNIMSIVEDISERKAAEESLQHTQARLSHAAEVATAAELSASIAHELNQPLSGIITNANTCLRMLDAEPPNVHGALETARRTIRDGNRASEVIRRLRALFSKSTLAIENVDLNEATREVIALSSSRLKKDQVVLRAELANGLPQVTGNRVQLQQVILNLLQNASDAMSAVDDRPRQLVVRTERDEDDGVRLSVQDTGVGFDPAAATQLFDAFYTTKNDGMGVGLSVSRSIIEGHRGHLWATPNDGPGATFSFYIPGRSKDVPSDLSHAARTFAQDSAARNS
jgi:PAS domain S-box-containing protein